MTADTVYLPDPALSFPQVAIGILFLVIAVVVAGAGILAVHEHIVSTRATKARARAINDIRNVTRRGERT